MPPFSQIVERGEKQGKRRSHMLLQNSPHFFWMRRVLMQQKRRSLVSRAFLCLIGFRQPAVN
jgi:hypothetical protein